MFVWTNKQAPPPSDEDMDGVHQAMSRNFKNCISEKWRFPFLEWRNAPKWILLQDFGACQNMIGGKAEKMLVAKRGPCLLKGTILPLLVAYFSAF